MQTSARPSGFTIIELMITILVLAILLGAGVPSFLDTIRNNRLIAETNEFVGALNFARSEALKRANTVSICAATSDTTCTGIGASDWSTGWLVFVDVNSNGTRDGGTEDVLQAHGALAAEFTLSSTNRGFLRYMATGTTGDGVEIFDLLRPGCTGNKARRLSVALIGRIRNETVACP